MSVINPENQKRVSANDHLSTAANFEEAKISREAGAMKTIEATRSILKAYDITDITEGSAEALYIINDSKQPERLRTIKL